MLTFFSDGTFLYAPMAIFRNTADFVTAGAALSVQVEHGLLRLRPAGTLRFTLITDTNPTAVNPSTYGAISNWSGMRHGLAPRSERGTRTVVMQPPRPARDRRMDRSDAQRPKVPYPSMKGAILRACEHDPGTFGGPCLPIRVWTGSDRAAVARWRNDRTWASRGHRRFWVGTT